METRQGHWILAKMGKKVLRPGGLELTKVLLKNLDIKKQDDVVEFAPGLGLTAAISLAHNPKSYTGIELDKEAAAILLKKYKTKINIVQSDATQSNLKNKTAHKIYGEAMLTMQSDSKKIKIIKEAHRILKKGGLYGIHELGLTPDSINENIKQEISQALRKSIQVNARPLTVKEWTYLIEKEGFEVIHTQTNGMKLLNPKRLLQDEGFFRCLKIIFNILTHPKERKRILAMKKVFTKYKKQLNAVCVIARKK